MSESPDTNAGGTRASNKRFFPRVLLLFAIIAAGIGGWSYRIHKKQLFPVMHPGEYLGEFDGAAAGMHGEKVKWYLEKSEDGSLLTAVLLPGWVPVTTNQLQEAATAEAGYSAPIEVLGGELSLRFSGEKNGAGNFKGKVRNIITGDSGEWILWPVKMAPVRSTDERKKIKLWLALSAERQRVEEEVKKAEDLLPKKKEERELLTKLVADGAELKERADQKFERERAQLKTVSAEYQEKLAESRELDSGYQVSQRVTGTGKLVSLSRESLSRDWRWVEAVLGASAREQRAAVAEKAQKTEELKEAIEKEKERIHDLLGQQSVYEENSGFSADGGTR